MSRAARNNSNLAKITNVEPGSSPMERLEQYGQVITINSKLGSAPAQKETDKICIETPRAQSSGNSDNFFMHRGIKYIEGFLKYETFIDVTNYAILRRLGAELKKKEFDENLHEQFNATLNIRLQVITSSTSQ